MVGQARYRQMGRMRLALALLALLLSSTEACRRLQKAQIKIGEKVIGEIDVCAPGTGERSESNEDGGKGSSGDAGTDENAAGEVNDNVGSGGGGGVDDGGDDVGSGGGSGGVGGVGGAGGAGGVGGGDGGGGGDVETGTGGSEATAGGDTDTTTASGTTEAGASTAAQSTTGSSLATTTSTASTTWTTPTTSTTPTTQTTTTTPLCSVAFHFGVDHSIGSEHVPSLADCCAACAASQDCTIIGYEEGAGVGGSDYCELYSTFDLSDPTKIRATANGGPFDLYNLGDGCSCPAA